MRLKQGWNIRGGRRNFYSNLEWTKLLPKATLLGIVGLEAITDSESQFTIFVGGYGLSTQFYIAMRSARENTWVWLNFDVQSCWDDSTSNATGKEFNTGSPRADRECSQIEGGLSRARRSKGSELLRQLDCECNWEGTNTGGPLCRQVVFTIWRKA